MNLAEMFKEEYIFIADSLKSADRFYADFADFLKEKGVISDFKKIKRLFVKREKLHTTAIGKGVAAPHIYSDEFSQFNFSVALIKNGIDFKAQDGGDVFLFFLIMSDERDVALHLKALAHIAHLVDTTDIVENLKKADNAAEVYRKLKEYDWKVK